MALSQTAAEVDVGDHGYASKSVSPESVKNVNRYLNDPESMETSTSTHDLDDNQVFI